MQAQGGGARRYALCDPDPFLSVLCIATVCGLQFNSTALHVAAMFGRAELVQVLVDAGADVDDLQKVPSYSDMHLLRCWLLHHLCAPNTLMI